MQQENAAARAASTPAAGRHTACRRGDKMRYVPLFLAVNAAAHAVRPLAAWPTLAYRHEAMRYVGMRIDLDDDAAASGAQPSSKPLPMVVSVILPEGQKPGDTIMLQPPGGLQCQVVVPEGAVPGQAFQVLLPTSVFASAAQAVPAPSSAPTSAPVPAAASAAEAESEGFLGSVITRESNPWLTSKAKRARAKFGDKGGFVDLAAEPEQQKLQQLERDLAQFKAERGGGATDSLAAEMEPTLLKRVIDTLGSVLTFNFFIIIAFFTWFLTGVGMQFGAHQEGLINAFRGAWDPLIMPLLTTHMTLTFLSAGLEKLSKSDA